MSLQCRRTHSGVSCSTNSGRQVHTFVRRLSGQPVTKTRQLTAGCWQKHLQLEIVGFHFCWFFVRLKNFHFKRNLAAIGCQQIAEIITHTFTNYSIAAFAWFFLPLLHFVHRQTDLRPIPWLSTCWQLFAALFTCLSARCPFRTSVCLSVDQFPVVKASKLFRFPALNWSPCHGTKRPATDGWNGMCWSLINGKLSSKLTWFKANN